jgi:iron complex transport system substrate-binding protein
MLARRGGCGQHRPPMKPPRVVSLTPFATELLAAVGAGERLVGRTHACDFPAEVSGIPTVTRVSLDQTGSDSAIDAAVRAAGAVGKQLVTVDSAALRDLRPDVVLVQDQCDVCGPGPLDVEAAFEGAVKPLIVRLSVGRFQDLWPNLQKTAEAAGASEGGKRAVARLKARVAEVLFLVAEADRPVTTCLDWLDPAMAAGHWMHDLAELAGATPRCGPSGGRSERVTWSEIASWNPHVIVAAPCGFDLERAVRAWIGARSGWEPQDFKAVRDGRVLVADGNAGFNRPGPRLVDSLEALAEALHPEKFKKPVHHGRLWRWA